MAIKQKLRVNISAPIGKIASIALILVKNLGIIYNNYKTRSNRLPYVTNINDAFLVIDRSSWIFLPKEACGASTAYLNLIFTKGWDSPRNLEVSRRSL